MTLGAGLGKLGTVVYDPNGPRVEETVAKELGALLPDARVLSSPEAGTGAATVAISVDPALADGENQRAELRITNEGAALRASAPNLLYPLFCKIRDVWWDEPADAFEAGREIRPRFTWLTGRDEILTGRLGFIKKRRETVSLADLERGMAEMARIGCTHVVVNELARRAAETGPDGEVYYRFYDYAPDIDQYVETRLTAGTYPREYLQANLDLVRKLAVMADRYGLTPGFYAAHPRSLPDKVFQKYPHLRGTRIDHAFRSYLPRYNFTVAHPAVRWHQAELIRTLLREVPELGFLKMLLNDSGSGFEYTASLYTGRNGGPYIIREWRPDAEIAARAAENVIRYYRGLRDAAREVRPDFHLMTGLKNIAEEQEPILAGMDAGINLQTQSQRSDVNDPEWTKMRSSLEGRGSHLLSDTLATGTGYLMGIPAPWTVAARLQRELDRGFDRVDIYYSAPHFAPLDINREVVAASQWGDADTDAVVRRAATQWVGAESADALVETWRQSDAAVSGTPNLIQFSWLGFTWYRFWARPFVPDIAAIPEGERDYYEAHILSVFNNPANVDMNADALWRFHEPNAADALAHQFDADVFPALRRAEGTAARHVATSSPFWQDLADRLAAFRCYSETIRNTCAWIGSVHGFLAATDDATRADRRAAAADVVARELANARALLDLWRRSDTDFMPLQAEGESVHHYGLNFGDLLEKKIDLMQRYGDREPRIDPNYMFRAPEGFPISESEYLGY